MFFSLLIILICTYVFFESLSVATESKGFKAYIGALIERSDIKYCDCGLTIFTKLIKQFAKECAPFCQVIRYILNAASAMVVAYWPVQTIKTQLFNHLYHANLAMPTYSPWLLLIAFALMFNVWGRMVYRVVGNRRSEYQSA